MADIQELRDLYPQFDQYGYTNGQILEWVGGQLKKDPMELAEYYGLRDPDQGDMSRGFEAGVDATQAIGYGAAGLAGDALGVDSVRDFGVQGYRNNMDEIALRARETDQFEGINSVGDAADFAQFYSGYALPQAATAIASGGLGGVLGKQAVKTAVKKYVNDGATDKAQDLLKKGTKVGQTSGIGAQAMASGLGGTYGQAAEQSIRDGNGVDDIDLGKVAGYGGLAGLAEFGTDVLTVGLAGFGPAKNLLDTAKKTRVRAAASRGTVGAAAEGVTEGVQTGLEDLGAGSSLEDARFFDPTSVAAGVIGGGQMGLAGGLLQRPEQSATTLDDPQIGQQLELDLGNPNVDTASETRQQDEANRAADAEAQQAEQQAKAQTRRRREAAQTFSEKDYEKERKTKLEADALNPNTQAGAAFEERIGSMVDPAKIKKELSSFLNEQKADPDTLEQEHIAELDRRIATADQMAMGQADLFDEGAPTEEAGPALVDPMTLPSDRLPKAIAKVEALVADGTLPENWADLPAYDGLNAALNGKKYNIKKFDAALAKSILPEDAVAAAPVDTLAPDTVVPETPQGLAFEFANSKLGAGWEDGKNGTALTNLLSSNDLEGFEARVNQLSGVKAGTPDEALAAVGKLSDNLKAGSNQKKVLDTFVGSLFNNEADKYIQASVKKGKDFFSIGYQQLAADAGIISKTEGKERETAQKAWNDVKPKLYEALGVTDENVGDILSMFGSDVSGETQFDSTNTNLSDAEAQTLLERRRGPDEDEIGDDGAAADLVENFDQNTADQDAQNQRGMGTTNSIGAGANLDRSAEDQEFTDSNAEQAEEDVAAQAAAAQAERAPEVRAEKLTDLKKSYAVVRGLYNQDKPTNTPDFDLLSEDDQLTFFDAAIERMQTRNEPDSEKIIQATINRIADSQPEKNNVDQIEPRRPSENAEQLRKERGTDAKKDQEGRGAPDSSGGQNTNPSEQQDFTAGQDRPKPNVVNKEKPTKRKLTNAPQRKYQTKFGFMDKADAAKALAEAKANEAKARYDEVIGAFSTPKTASKETFEQIVKDLTGKKTNWRVNYYNNVSDVIAARIIKGTEGPTTAQMYGGAYGWVTTDSEEVTHAHFILENIPEGAERAAFMHEIGSHIGIDSVVDEGTRELLQAKIMSWAFKDDNSIESILSKKAMSRLRSASKTDDRMTDSPELVTSETIAYFLEEATVMGVEPSVKTPVGRFLRDLYALFKKALRKINFMSENLKAQDVVDLAYGAARMELRGRKHGTVANFRKFNHKYMSTGEGAQAYSWGTYLAERFSIARWYLRTDEKRKAKDLVSASKGDPNNPINQKLKLEDVSAGLAQLIESYRVGSKNVITSMAALDRVNGERRNRMKPAFDPPRIVFEDSYGGADFDATMVKVKVSYPTMSGTRQAYDLADVVSNVTVDTNERKDAAKETMALKNQKEAAYSAYKKTHDVEGNLVTVDTSVSDDDMLAWDAPINDKDNVAKNLKKMLGDMPLSTGFNLLREMHASSVYFRPEYSDIKLRFSRLTSQFFKIAPSTGFLPDYLIRKKAESRALAELKAGLNEFVEETFDTATGKDMYRSMQRLAGSPTVLDGFRSMLSEKTENKPAIRGLNDYSGKEDMIVSMLMDDYGVGGVIFPDAGTMGATSEQTGLANNAVIFNEDNLIVVSKTPGKQVSDRKNTVNEIRFGINRDWVSNNYGATTKQFFDDASFIAKAGANSVKFLHQIVSEVQQTMPSLGRWYRAMLQAEATRNEIRKTFEDIAVRARGLNPARMNAVNDFIGRSTFEQKWAYDPEIKNKKVVVDSEMANLFQALGTDEQQLIRDIFSHGEKMRQRKLAIAKKLGVSGKFFSDSSLEGPYAPLKRFGNFAGELKSSKLRTAEIAATAENASKATKDKYQELKSDPAHYVVSFFDTIGSARRFVDANKGKYQFTQASRLAPDLDSERMSNPAVYEKVIAALKADKDSSLDPASKKAFRELVQGMYFQSLDEQNARLSGARRMNRAGYDSNMVRSFLSHARAESSLIAQMENGTEINTALAVAATETLTGSGDIRDPSKQEAYNMVAKHYADTLQQKETPVQDRIAAMNSVYMLTTSVGYHLTNATQPIMVTIPKMAADFNNYSGSWSALFKGYKVAMAVTKMSSRMETEVDVTKAPAQYRKLLEQLQLHQLLDVGMEEDLGEFDRFNTGYEALNRTSDTLGTITHKLYQVARFVEAQNRVSSAIAAYDMANANPQKLSKLNMTAEQYATAVVEDTQGNFSRLDAPLLLKALPKVTVQYRKYQLLMAWHYTNSFNQAFRGESPEIKATGRRALSYSLAHAALGAGATGVPLMSTVFWLTTFMGDQDEPDDLERWINRNVDDGKLGDMLARGVPAFFGLDMSTKLSQSKIFQPLPYLDFQADESGVKDAFFNIFAGPSGTTAVNFGRSASHFAEGDLLKGIEYATPKGIRSITETYRLATEGYTDRIGDVVVDPRDISAASLMLNAMGLPASEINEIKWTRGQQYELGEYFKGESSRLRKAYVEAYRDRDRGAMTELRQEWRELQASKDRVRPFFNNATGELKRQNISVLLKAPRAQLKRQDKKQDRFN